MKLPNLHRIVHEETYVPKRLPQGWTVKTFLNGINELYYEHKSGLIVMASTSTMSDKSKWIHVSVSHKKRQPNWKDMYGVKRVFIGDNNEAIQVFPKNEDLIDLANCYHLWSLVKAPR